MTLQLNRRQILIAGLGALAGAAIRLGSDASAEENLPDADGLARLERGRERR